MILGTKLTPKRPQFDRYDLKKLIKVIFDKLNGKIMYDLWGVVIYKCS